MLSSYFLFRWQILFGASMAILIASLAIGTHQAAKAQVLNNFDISDASVDPELIRKGGPPGDGIPSIDTPEFHGIDEAGWLRKHVWY